MNCKIPGCKNKLEAKGYCVKHYRRLTRNGHPLILKKERHGKSFSKEYASWHSMIQRCENRKSRSYKDYGGRGISVCSQWKSSFLCFFRDMGDRPDKTSLGRINNNDNYYPKNCRWETLEQQNNNQRKKSNNTSGITGVSWYEPSRKWKAQITRHGKNYNLGHFDSKDEARQKYESEKSIKEIW